MKYLRVKNWDRFQHYKNRRPLWIKLYVDLLDDYEFARLPDEAKWHLVGIYLIASRNERGIFQNDAKWVAVQLQTSTEVDLKRLVQAGFLLPVASKSLAKRYQVASLEIEREIEKEKDPPVVPPRGDGNGAASNDARHVFDHWLQARGKSERFTLTPGRRKKIEARLNDFSPTVLCQAIDAVDHDPWAKRKLHDDLTIIFRNSDQVERFLDMADNPPPRTGGLTAREIATFYDDEPEGE